MDQWILRSLINYPALFPLPCNGHLSHEVSATTDCNGVGMRFDCPGERAQSPDAMILCIPLHLCYIWSSERTHEESDAKLRLWILFTCMRLAVSFIQSNMHCIFKVVYVFFYCIWIPWESNHDLGVASTMFYCLSYRGMQMLQLLDARYYFFTLPW